MNFLKYFGLGMLGGLALAIARPQDYSIEFLGTDYPLDIIGEVFIGGTTALAAVYILSFLTGANPDSNELHVRRCGVSIIAGFIGIPLLTTMAGPALSELGHKVEKLDGQVEELQTLEQARSLLGEGQIYYETAKAAIVDNVEDQAKLYIGKSLRYLDEALEIVPNDALTLIWKAKAKRLEFDITQDEKLLDQAIEIVTTLVGQKSLDKMLKARASFNAACYHCLKKSELETVLKYLKQALDGNSGYANNARDERDFDSIRSQSEFKSLIDTGI
jgi:hypothetical protein